ncbi:MAG: hypothetical protein CSB34_02890 [Desulfobulbus propionicus]|nr:MAG: hypothetical protein CSB34_02890 [Desulfobulbus propionicus]
MQKVLEKITATTPELEVVAVDILSEPGLCLQKQIVMIPALLTDSGKKLSGIWISESRIREFIDQEMAAEKSQ